MTKIYFFGWIKNYIPLNSVSSAETLLIIKPNFSFFKSYLELNRWRFLQWNVINDLAMESPDCVEFYWAHWSLAIRMLIRLTGLGATGISIHASWRIPDSHFTRARFHLDSHLRLHFKYSDYGYVAEMLFKLSV